jgi:hypothetical protein
MLILVVKMLMKEELNQQEESAVFLYVKIVVSKNIDDKKYC